MNDFLTADPMWPDAATLTIIAGSMILVGLVGIAMTLINHFTKDTDDEDKYSF